MRILAVVLLALSLILLGVTVYSLAIDVWLSELVLKEALHNGGDRVFPSLGVWETCLDVADYCVETSNVLHHDLKAVSQKRTGWLFIAQMCVTLGAISLGYATIVVLRRVISFKGCGLTYYYVFSTTYTMFYAAALVLFMTSATHYFEFDFDVDAQGGDIEREHSMHGVTFEWGLSIKLCFLSTLTQIGVLLMIAGWHALRHCKNKKHLKEEHRYDGPRSPRNRLVDNEDF